MPLSPGKGGMQVEIAHTLWYPKLLNFQQIWAFLIGCKGLDRMLIYGKKSKVCDQNQDTKKETIYPKSPIALGNN